MALAFVLAVIHVLLICDPLPEADNWFFVDSFLYDAVYGGVEISDFLAKRGSSDHAQPLNKVLMWVNARFFGLDFMLEALLALVFGLLAMLLVYRQVGRDAAASDQAPAWLAMIAAAGVFFSANSPMIYIYSMVTMWFVLYLLIFAIALLTWRDLGRARFSPALPVLAMVFGIVADDVAIMGLMSLAGAIVLYALRSGEFKRPFVVLAGALAGVVASRMVFAYFSVGQAGNILNESLAHTLGVLWSKRAEAWLWWASPASNGLIYAETARAMLGAAAVEPIRNTLGVVLAIAHVWFWRQAVIRPMSGLWFLAIVCMLFFYAHVAGLVLSRVPGFGTEYLEQPRYISFYQLGIVALMLMWATVAAPGMKLARTRLRRSLAVLVPLLVIAIQVPLSYSAYKQAPYIGAFQQVMARQMKQLARDPVHPPADCVITLNVCTFPESDRIRLMHMFVENRLGVFSPWFPTLHPHMAKAAAAEQGP